MDECSISQKSCRCSANPPETILVIRLQELPVYLLSGPSSPSNISKNNRNRSDSESWQTVSSVYSPVYQYAVPKDGE